MSRGFVFSVSTLRFCVSLYSVCLVPIVVRGIVWLKQRIRARDKYRNNKIQFNWNSVFDFVNISLFFPALKLP